MTRALVPTRLPQLIKSCQGHGFIRKAAFSTSVRRTVAHDFTMPAMSPTMTEGNIANWKVQEGDSFAAGDVLLEIETDKAQMEVEAQDDGQMAKIIQPSGSKGVKVGVQIAITADPDDDIASLDLSAAQDSNQAPKKESSSPEAAANKAEQAIESIKSDTGRSNFETTSEHPIDQAPRSLKYPLYPSVVQLLHQHGISEEESNRIPASGPNGRLLKGDVLSSLGQIGASYAHEQSRRIQKLGHMDLSNIEIVAPPKASEETVNNAVALEEQMVSVSEVTLPISLAAVDAVRERIERVLGIRVSIETFIARATQLCNDDLPRSASQPYSADELFNAVLGLDQVSAKTTGGMLIPQIQAFSTTVAERPRSSLDIIEELSSSVPRSIRSQGSRKIHAAVDPQTSVFTVSVASGDEKRARVFLERLKTVLQVEPGRLVL